MALDPVAGSVALIIFLVSIPVICSAFLTFIFFIKHPSFSWKLKLPGIAAQIFAIGECAILCIGLILFQIENSNNRQPLLFYFIIAVAIHTIPQLGATIIILVRLYYLPNRSIPKKTFILSMVFAIILCFTFNVLVVLLAQSDEELTIYTYILWMALHVLSILLYVMLISILNKRLYPLIIDKNRRLETYDTDRYQHTCSTTIINGILYSIKCIQLSITLFISNIIYSLLFVSTFTVSIFDIHSPIFAKNILYIFYILLMINLLVHSMYILFDLYRNNGVDPYNKMLCFSCIYTYCCESGINWYIMNKAYNNLPALKEKIRLDSEEIHAKVVIDDESHVNILCFGDSLTAGYCNDGREYHPYSKELDRMIKEQLVKDDKDDIKINVIESGKFDECVTKTMYHRLEGMLKQNKFDIVIFLGGTNDIGYNVEVQQICSELERIYQLILEHNDGKCKLIAVSIPCRLDENASNTELSSPKTKINEYIFRYCSGNKDNDAVAYCDLYKCFNSIDDKEKKKLYDMDQLHFSAKGYNKLAALLFPIIIDLAL